MYVHIIAHGFLQVRLERMYNFASLLKWPKCTYDYSTLAQRDKMQKLNFYFIMNGSQT